MTKKHDIDLKEVEHLAGLGLTQEEIASCLGITTSTFYDWKKKPSFSEFSEALKKGKGTAKKKACNALWDEGVNKRNLGALIFWLKNNGWSDKVDHTTDGDKINTIPAFGARPNDA